MQKIILILVDLEIIPDGFVYLLDEYENSLGTNVMDFLPDYLDTILSEKQIQLLVTTHHPYLINKVDTIDWYIFNRKGRHVSIQYGEENIERFGRSKQERFTQLINSDIYNNQ